MNEEVSEIIGQGTDQEAPLALMPKQRRLRKDIEDIASIIKIGRSPPTTVNSSVRTREYLTTAEIERLMAAARKSSRYGHRDATMILIGYRHGAVAAITLLAAIGFIALAFAVQFER